MLGDNLSIIDIYWEPIMFQELVHLLLEWLLHKAY